MSQEGDEIGWRLEPRQLEDGSWITIAEPAPWNDLSAAEKWRSVWHTFVQHKDDAHGMELVERLLREDAEPIPIEGKRLLAELIDSKHSLLNLKLDRRVTKTRTLRQKELEQASAVLTKMERDGCSRFAAAKELYGDSFRNAMRAAESFERATRGRKPFSPWDAP